jgi:cytochrome c oxidase assembly factor CtaG
VSALPAPSYAGLVTEWTWQPLALIAAALLAGWYAYGVHRVRAAGQPWPASRILVFAIGIAALIWATCGFAGAYLDSLFWVWTAQQLTLLLVVPYLILAGGPLLLGGPPVQRLLSSRFVRTLGNPLIGPALVPLLAVVLFFGPLPGWAIDVPPIGWIEQLAVLAIGALIVLPLVGGTGRRTSLAIGLSLAIGSLELVLDAVPGIALRLHRTVTTSFFDFRAVHPWTPTALHDQQTSGSVLWCVAELLDLPFLVLVFVLWLKADAQDAAEVDAVLEAERIARGEPEPIVEGDYGPTDAPWWLTDPSMQERMRRQR